MLSSIDGKITSGASDKLDVDKDWAKIDGLKDGLQQYYDIEQTTDLFSLNTARVLEKIGINSRIDVPQKSPVTFVVIDRNQRLKESGIRYLTAWLKKLIVVTTNANYDTFGQPIDVIFYKDEIDFADLFHRIKRDYKTRNITIQSGGTINNILLRAKLIDYVNIVFAPVLVGGKDTSTLIDGESLRDRKDLGGLGVLELLECRPLRNSYVYIRYKVIS